MVEETGEPPTLGKGALPCHMPWPGFEPEVTGEYVNHYAIQALHAITMTIEPRHEKTGFLHMRKHREQISVQ